MASMSSVDSESDRRREACPTFLAPGSALVMAAAFGLMGGFLDFGGFLLEVKGIYKNPYYFQGRDLPWTIPAANLLILLVPGLAVAAINRLRPGTVSFRAAAWLFAALALWGPLLRMPLMAVASLILAAGLGRLISQGLAARRPAFARLAPWCV